MEIGLLADHRNDLIAERTESRTGCDGISSRCAPSSKASLKKRSLSETRQLDRIDRRLPRQTPEARVRVARAQVAQIRSLTCGPLTAAILIGRTAGAERFHTDASFALQAGIAPIKCSSGQHQQHRLNRGGDRQLNHALHIIAITRARHDPATREYLARKQAEGKTRKARCAAATSPAASGGYSPSRRSQQTRPSHANTRPRQPSPRRSPSQNAPPHLERSTTRPPGRSRCSASPSRQQSDHSLPSAASYQPPSAADQLRTTPSFQLDSGPLLAAGGCQQRRPMVGCRSRTNAKVCPALAQRQLRFPSSRSQLGPVADYRFDGIACKVSANTGCAFVATSRTLGARANPPASMSFAIRSSERCETIEIVPDQQPRWSGPALPLSRTEAAASGGSVGTTRSSSFRAFRVCTGARLEALLGLP
jgi:hypothetical protein